MSGFGVVENTSITNGTHSVAVCQSGSYDSMYVDYRINFGNNKRVGTMAATVGGTTVEYSEVCTVDIGTTSDIVLNAKIDTGNIAIGVVNSGANTWAIKAQVRYL